MKETGARDGNDGKKVAGGEKEGAQKEGPLRFTATGPELNNSDRVWEQLKPVVAFDQSHCVSPPHGHHPSLELSLVSKALFSEGGIHARAFKLQIPPSIPLR